MRKNIIGVDLAKRVIQVCVYKNSKIHSNTEMTPMEFTNFLATTEPSTLIFESCSTSNYWKQRSKSLGHDSYLISPHLVSSVRQNQKTDKNDALAIVQASLLPGIKFCSGKSKDQQQLQSISRLRELAVKQKTALNNQLIALLAEFNISISRKLGGLVGTIEATLEDVENDFSDELRQALHTGKEQYLSVIEAIQHYDRCLENALNMLPDGKKLLKIEGVGPMNAVNLYISFGCSEMSIFSSGRDAAASVGLTPLQHSSGGKSRIGSIGRGCKNSMMRSLLIAGAMSVVYRLSNREAKTKKELWLKALIERRGKKCAAVALANKNVRTAFAMLSKGTEYTAELLLS